jgi:DNA-binding transcriptional LysR family regulator
MDLRRLRHAVALSRHLNFTKAADALNITQSALSRSIQALESECQLRLFDRNRNMVAITANGREFIHHAKLLLRKEAELLDMVSHAARGDGGNVALGMAPLAARTLLAPLMTDMIHKPGFRATVSIGAPRKLLPMLLDESIHICVCTGRTTRSNALFATVPLAEFPVAMVVRAGHPLTRATSLEPADLDRFPHLRTRSFDLDDDESGADTEDLHNVPALAIEDYDVLMKIAASTDAVWLTSPISAKEGILHGSLVAIPAPWISKNARALMTAYYLKNRTLSPTAQRILDKLIAVSEEAFEPTFMGEPAG